MKKLSNKERSLVNGGVWYQDAGSKISGWCSSSKDYLSELWGKIFSKEEKEKNSEL